MKKLIAVFLFCASSFIGLQGQTEYYLDFNGKIHTNVPVKYDYEVGDGYRIFFNEGKYSAKDRSGKVVVEPTADKLVFLGSGVFAKGDGYKIQFINDSYSTYDIGCIGFVNGYMIVHRMVNGYHERWAIDTTGKLTDEYYEFINNGNYLVMKRYEKGEQVCRLYDKKSGLVNELKGAYDANGISEGLIKVRTPDWKWGFADITTGKLIIPYNKKYNVVGDFFDGKAYVQTEKETFCIDKEGKKLSIPKEQCINATIYPINGINIGIKFISDKDSLLALIEPASGVSTGFVYNRYKSKEGFFLMSDDKTIDIFNYRGKKIIDNLSKEAKLQLNFGILLVNDPSASAFSVYNRDGKQLLTQSNDVKSVDLFDGYLKIVANKRLFLATKNDNVWYFDFSGKLQDTEPENTEYPLADGYRMVKQGASYGAKKADGSICIPAEHASLRYLGSNLFFVEDRFHSFGYFYKANGQKLLQEKLEIYKFYNGFANGLITLTSNYDKEFSLIDSTGNMLFSELRYSPDDYYDVIRAGSTIMYRNSYEKKTLDVDYVSYFSEGRFLVGKNDKWGIADIQGNILLQPTCNVIYPFINGVAKIVNDGNELYIDINGKPIENATPFVSHEITTFGGMTKMYTSNGSEYLLSFRNNKTKKETGFKYIIYEPEILKNEKYLNGFIFVSNKEKTGSCLINYKGEEIASNLGIHDLNYERKTAMEGSNILVRTIKKAGDTKNTYAKVFDREGRELLCVTDTFGKIELMNGFIKCFKQTEQDRIDDLKKPVVTHDDVEEGPSNNLYTVSFIMQKVSSGLGTRSVDYACIYVEVTTTKNPSDSQLISAAQSAKNSVSLNGFRDYQTIVTKGGSSKAKKIVTSKVSLSSFRVEYAEF